MTVALLAVLMTAGCSSLVNGVAEPVTAAPVLVGNGVDPSFVHGTDNSGTDRLAATALTDVQAFWKQNFPTVFGKRWQPLTGGVYSVDTANDKASAPPCTQSASDVEGNAFYCPAKDSVAWDRDALLPVLRDRFGDAAVVLVLAHEMGHAVQARTAPTAQMTRTDPDHYPTILIETMADCYAGSFVWSVVDGKAQHLRINAKQLDSALGALVTFRDPVGTSSSAEGAHGDAFDRVSAFQDGYQQGPKLCSGMSVANRQFTQRAFTNPMDAANGGNLPLDDLVGAIVPDLSSYFGQVVGSEWAAPKLTQTAGAASCPGGDQGPVAFCSSSDSIVLSTKGTIPALVTSIGDYAAGTLIASRFGLAALSQLGKPVTGADAGKNAVCLAGAYTASVLNRTGSTLSLSPGDLDKSVRVLLTYDYAARSAAGKDVPTGFDRVSAFRGGFRGGPSACGV
jgi:predicted metalloprotease